MPERQAGEDNGDANRGGMPGQQRVNHDISIGELALANRELERPEAVSSARMTFLPRPRKDAKSGRVARIRRGKSL